MSQTQTEQEEPETDTAEAPHTTLENFEVDRPENFHVALEQEGELKLVPAGGAVKFPPCVEQVHVLFADNVEYRIWIAPLSASLEPSNGETGEETKRVHRPRSEGDSEWDSPWAVEVAFEELPGGWLSPMECRFEGIAVHASMGETFQREVMDDEDLLERLV